MDPGFPTHPRVGPAVRTTTSNTDCLDTNPRASTVGLALDDSSDDHCFVIDLDESAS